MKFSKWFVGGLAGALVLAFVAGAALAAKPVGIRQASDGSEYSAGWLCVKFKASLREQLSGTLLPNAVQLRSGVLMRNGVLLEPRLGVPSVDALNAKYGVSGIERMVPSPNPIPALKEYGVDLIFTMHLDPSLDLERVAREYKALPEVEDAYPSTVYRPNTVPNDSLVGRQWALPKIRAFEGYDITHGDTTGVSVWVVNPDIGLQWTHPDIENGLWINGPEDYNHNGKFEDYPSSNGGDEDGVDNDGNGFVDDVIGWDWMQWDNDPSPNAGGDDHGTATWGCCMATTNNVSGIASPGYRTHGMGTNTGTGGLLYYPWDALNYGTQMRAKVGTMSWGGGANNQGVLDAAWSAGMNLLASCGSGGAVEVRYPGASNHVTGVMASNQSDYKCGFSNYNGTLPSQKYYDLCAPGENILTTNPGSAYAYYSGTSFSNPIAAGVVAMMRAYQPALSNDQIDTVLYHTCDTMPDPLYKNGQLGWGRVNHWRALSALTGVEGSPSHQSPVTSHSAFPNPFTSFAQVSGHASGRFALYDISGRKVGTYQGDRIGEGLGPGVYFLRAEKGNKKPFRIVKVR